MKMRSLGMASLAGLLLGACAPSLPPGLLPAGSQPGTQPSQLRQLQAGSPLQTRFVQSEALPAPLLAEYVQRAQRYADDVSRRRQLDFFELHPNPVGLSLTYQQHQAHLLSFLGTAKTRTDLNLELRLLAGQGLGLNLNYSGPVTQSGSQQVPASEPPLASSGSQSTATNPFVFELITGLPGAGVTEAYGQYLDGLARYLRYRYQSRPVRFDDGPLIYAIQVEGQLLGFVFFNQRNLLTLGERKYADLQSVVVISPERKILGSYTLLGFNPKTAKTHLPPTYRLETHPEWGNLVEFGDL